MAEPHPPPGAARGQGAWAYCLMPAIVMSLGWGLRGFIGGGPMGAMIPGAMIALLLCHLLELDQRTSAFVAAFGAIGVGLGGQMTYGQTIGFIVQPETFSWGLLGLSVKGGIWGLLGGAVLGFGFIHQKMSRKSIGIAILLLVVGTLVGWKLINQPRLIYFSNPHDRPRAEIWAGLLLGAVVLLGYLSALGHGKIPWHFALWGTMGGAIGFGGGGLWMALGKKLPEAKAWASWWKLMELTFGFSFGLALGWAAWLRRGLILSMQTKSSQQAEGFSFLASLLAALGLGGLALWSDANVSIVWGFTTYGVILLAAAIVSEKIAWQVALTVTSSAFLLDLAETYLEEPSQNNIGLRITFVAITGLICGWIITRRERAGKQMVRWSFLALMWLAMAVSFVKTFAHGELSPAHALVELTFALQAIILTVFYLRQRGATGTKLA